MSITLTILVHKCKLDANKKSPHCLPRGQWGQKSVRRKGARPAGPGAAIPINREITLLTATKAISGLNTQPVEHPVIFGAPSIHPASYSHCWACTWTALLTCRLRFGQVGLEPCAALTHWVTISNFIPPFENPNDLGLTWHEHPFIHASAPSKSSTNCCS